jgi:SAM-dependent MidA family methyltransferase
MTRSPERVILPEPPDDLKRHSRRLREHIVGALGDEGTMSFRRYMELALYAPGLGYYSAGLHKFGEDGDFVTSPELGELFARCLARQAGEIGEALGDWEILELGAGSGRLAADLLAALGPERAPRRYRILERSADLAAVQRGTIARRAPALADRVEWLSAPPAEPWRGVLLANEVVDALAAECFAWRDGAVRQRRVGLDGDGFAWRETEAPPALRDAVLGLPESLRTAWPDGYVSEIRPDLGAWLGAVTDTLDRGVAFFIDYGYPRGEYYRAERRTGTLMCHYRHRAHDDPFRWPGLQDITAFVDFSALALAGREAGMALAGYTSQALFLLGCGLDEVMAEASPATERERQALAAEAKQLTLPGLMGERFQAIALARRWDAPLRGFGLRDLARRL